MKIGEQNSMHNLSVLNRISGSSPQYHINDNIFLAYYYLKMGETSKAKSNFSQLLRKFEEIPLGEKHKHQQNFCFLYELAYDLSENPTVAPLD